MRWRGLKLPKALALPTFVDHSGFAGLRYSGLITRPPFLRVPHIFFRPRPQASARYRSAVRFDTPSAVATSATCNPFLRSCRARSGFAFVVPLALPR